MLYYSLDPSVSPACRHPVRVHILAIAACSPCGHTVPGSKLLDGEGEPHHTAKHAKIPRISGNFSVCADSMYQALFPCAKGAWGRGYSHIIAILKYIATCYCHGYNEHHILFDS